ncbi:hypothetical protein, partial [Endozoicomonas sp. ONNA2]|uniref:hypothetical protein n=1 Tax=Endozoicomonas sp. ONNA2 TaxID=2828741 RepID=UPI002147D67D
IAGLFDEEAGIFRPIYRKRSKAVYSRTASWQGDRQEPAKAPDSGYGGVQQKKTDNELTEVKSQTLLTSLARLVGICNFLHTKDIECIFSSATANK